MGDGPADLARSTAEGVGGLVIYVRDFHNHCVAEPVKLLIAPAVWRNTLHLLETSKLGNRVAMGPEMARNYKYYH